MLALHREKNLLVEVGEPGVDRLWRTTRADGLEPVVTEWLDEASVALAHVIVNTTAVMEFGTAIVDGIMPRPIVERLVEKVRERISVFPVLTTDRPAVVIGRLGADAPARGAALKPMYRRLFSRDLADLDD